MTEKIEVPKNELDDLLSDLHGFLRDKPEMYDDFWYAWINQKNLAIEQFRKKYILGEKEDETWVITRTDYFNATNYERDYQGAECICEEFEIFLSEEKATEVFNKFRIDHKHYKRFRSGPRWFSVRSLGIIHYQLKRVSEWELKILKGEEDDYM